MRNDHSLRTAGAGGGLCKAFKDMKSKVATHTGVSLSFVELVATSPAVGLLPALAPSPRSPSALLHRHMHLGPSLCSPAARKPFSSEQSAGMADTDICVADNAENSGTQSTCTCAGDAEISGIQCTSSSSSCDLPCVQASALALSSTDPSSSTTCHGCGHSHMDLSSTSTHPSSPRSTCNSSSRHLSPSSIPCTSSSSLACHLPCACSSSSLSCGFSAGHSSSLGDLPYGDQLASSSCDLSREHSACRHSHVPPNLVEAKSDQSAGSEDDRCHVEKKSFKVDLSVGQQQSSHLPKANCMKRSKLLKSKLRSSFKSLSVQVPRKAFPPLHSHTSPQTSSSSLSSQSSTPASPASSKSHAASNSLTPRKTWMLKGQAFACKLTKSLNQRQSLADSGSHSHTRSRSRMQDLSPSEMAFSKLSSCEVKRRSLNRVTSAHMMRDSVMAPFIAVPVALCALFYGKSVAFIVVTVWLVAMSVAISVCSLWRKPRICSLRSH